MSNTQVLFVNRPDKGKLDYAKTFSISNKYLKPKAEELKPNEVVGSRSLRMNPAGYSLRSLNQLVRNVVLGFDAAMRAWMGVSFATSPAGQTRPDSRSRTRRL